MAPDTTIAIAFVIEAAPLDAALGAWSGLTRIRIEAGAGVDLGGRSAGVAGLYTPPAALRALLAGTGLEVRFLSTSLALLVQRSPGPAEPVYSLAPLLVRGERGRTYAVQRTRSATRTDTPLRDVPQSVSVITRDVIRDQGMQGMADVVRYVPGASMGQGEGHRDAPTIRGNGSTADFFVDGVRDDAQYYRDLYNVERVEALKGPNAMIFGRGGAGGVLNRVTKQARGVPIRSLTASFGSHDQLRATADIGAMLLADAGGRDGADVSYRVNAMYESGHGFREASDVRRFGVNPAIGFNTATTSLRASYEYFGDDRNVDRGLPSYQGRPFGGAIRTFFGNPDSSDSNVRVGSLAASAEHMVTPSITLRNRLHVAAYDKFYQNSFASGAVNNAGSQVNLAAYSNATYRRNLIDQLEATVAANTGTISHTILAGAEASRQTTSNYRMTGYYNGSSTSVSVDVRAPTVSTPIAFRQSATDADNETEVTTGALYVQDQLSLSPRVQAIAGVRAEMFHIDFADHRTTQRLDRRDVLISPRAGLVYKPAAVASIYTSYGVSHLPAAGDQFSSLTVTTTALEPERIRNYEAGVKWDIRPALSLTAAAYRLDRTNTSAPDPSDATKTVQTGSQRTKGIEVGAAGAISRGWQMVGGFALQDAVIVAATRAAAAGATVPLVPHRTASLWNRFQLMQRVGAGVGVISQSRMFAAVDNTVVLPGFTRVDAALFLRMTSAINAQVNVENVLGTRYYATSHGNNNIMPGAPRSVRLAITTAR